ncbi:MAG TPA: DUF1800 family protein [Terracidiphilus sp.]|nr:DUF1800 family protein [Terracidiphilus sp.]
MFLKVDGSLSRNAAVWSIVFFSLAALFGCGGPASIDPAFFGQITVSQNSVRVNEHIQIQSYAAITRVPLTYSVNGVAWGNAEFGTVDGNGLYTAPSAVPAPNTVTITAVPTAHPDYPPGTVEISVLNPIPVLNSVTPTAFTEGTTTVALAGSGFIFSSQVLWNGAPVPTTYVSSTKLVAVIAAPNPGTFPILVTNPDPGSANSQSLSITVGPGQVVLKLQPYLGTDVRVRNSLNMGLTVEGTTNTAVTLFINGIQGGNATLGTVVQNADGSLTYTAPPVVPTPSNAVQLKVVSVDNPSVFITRNIAVLNPVPVLETATPMSFSVGSASVVVQGKDFINGATVLMNGSPVSTTFDSGTQLTATLNLTQPGDLDLQVLNPAPGPATSSDLIAEVQGTVPVPVVSPQDASRFLTQATFGPTDEDIHHLSLIGYQAWLNEQFSMSQTKMEPGVEQAILFNNPPCASGDQKCISALFMQNNQDQIYVENAFWQQSVSASDQLRQRVQYALSEMFVISGMDANIQNMPRGEANYYDMLGADAFGNFRQLLEDVTLNPMMGEYLSMLGNDKGNATTDPDENYAREVMQLFTIGLYQLNDDGSQKLDGTGQPIPTYSNDDVMGLAKVLTGFSWNVPGNTSDAAWSNCCMYVGTGYGEDLLPLQAYPNHHSTAQKNFLGVTIPMSASPDTTGDLKIALDTLFNHPNLPLFFCKQLIQHLVTSNPSPAYVSRVAAVFKDNGSGVRGDMKAVITAILLDPEARDAVSAAGNPQYGKIREPLLRFTEWARAFTAQSRTGGYYMGTTEGPIWGLGQMALRSPSVFNWFAPGYVPPGTSIEQAGLVAPEMQITNVSTVVGYLNFMQYAIGADDTNGPDLYSAYGAELGLADAPDQLVDRVNLLLMAGQMDSTLRSQIINAVSAIPIPASGQTAIDAARAARVKTAIYLTMASPSFAAQN